jgi:hypothetical protein
MTPAAPEGTFWRRADDPFLAAFHVSLERRAGRVEVTGPEGFPDVVMIPDGALFEPLRETNLL